MVTYLPEAAFWLSLAALWWLFHGPYRRHQVDLARYRLGVVQDELLDALPAAAVSFEGGPYREARDRLDALGLTIDRHSGIWLLALLIRMQSDRHWAEMCARREEAFQRELRALPRGEREAIEYALDQAQRVVIAYIVRVSLVMRAFRLTGKVVRPIPEWLGRRLDLVRNAAIHESTFVVRG